MKYIRHAMIEVLMEEVRSCHESIFAYIPSAYS